MLAYTHPACMAHDPGPGHPESPARLEAVLQAVRAAFPNARWRDAPAASREQLLRVHTRDLVACILDTPVEAPYRLDEDTVLSPGSALAALHAAGAAVAAVDAVIAGGDRLAFCAVRPPGHHAEAGRAMGFCLFNSAAVAAAHAVAAHGLRRVSIVDFDVHHGNGSQAIFQDEPRVQYLSSHQWPLFPGTGLADERGTGNLRNAPLPPGAGSDAFREAWRETLLPELERFAPELLLVSAGFDGHRLDPLADLMLEADDYRWLAGELAGAAARHGGGRVVSLLEGGYSLAALRSCVVAHLRGLGA
ncbi:histone deacetylase family protein [Arenimonas fontis]|uniref:Histone deacetylase family protein n=1 Tax=Arenimonas fontis TaxID=2608255 RepID=A0A5B2Z8T1_9GAMM|nr:histone deacetylase family protein [Arenimonas fontis]KAA2283700.1 histone deacetylase family protein [Arenimonas fontis]